MSILKKCRNGVALLLACMSAALAGLCFAACNIRCEEVDVVLFTGQSNMVGRETEILDVEIPEGYAYEYKYADNRLTELKNPVGETFGEGDGQLEVSSGSSIVPQFCLEYVRATGRRIVAVQAAHGGRDISFFVEDQPMYNSIVAKYRACLDYLNKSRRYKVGRCFYVMFQGETDTLSTSREDYKSRYLSFHNALKSQFGFAFGALLQTGLDVKSINDGKVELTTEEDVARIAAAKTELARENDDIIMINVKAMNYHNERPDYMLGDRYGLVHYNGAGLTEIATDSCKALLNYLGYGEAELKGADPVTYL